MANEYSKWATEFAKKNGRQPTFDEYLAYKRAQSPGEADDSQQPVTPDQWVQDFVAENGRQPTFAEYRAHQVGAEDSPKNAPVPTGAASTPPVDEPTATSNEEDSGASAEPSSMTKRVRAGEKPKLTAKPHRWRTPLLIVIVLIFVTAGGVFGYGWFTQRDKAELERLYTAAIRDKDVAGLLQLFPAEQTHSLFAKDGAKQIIQAESSFKRIAGKRVAGLTVEHRAHWLFFQYYYLSTQLTALRVPKQYKDATITYRKRAMKAKQIDDNPLFWGTYTFQVQPKTEKTQKVASPAVTVTLAGGEKKAVVLPVKAAVAAAQPVDPNKWQTGVPKDLQKIYFRKVSGAALDIEDFISHAGGNDKVFSITGGPGDGTTLERTAYRTIAKNTYIVRGQTPLDLYRGTYYVKAKYEDGAHGKRLAVYKIDGIAKGTDNLTEAEKSTQVEWFDAQTIVAPKGRTVEIGSGSFLRLNADFTYTEEAVKDKPWAAMIGGGHWYFDGNEIKGDRQHLVTAFFASEADYRAGKPLVTPVLEKSEDKLAGQNAYSFVISARSNGDLEYKPADQTGRVYPVKYADHKFSDEQETYAKWVKNAPGQGGSD